MARFYADLSELEKLTLIDMSYSRIDTYMTCPAKYFYKYISKEDEVFGAAGTLGNIIHDVLEDHVGEEEFEASEFLKSFYLHREQYDPERLISDELIEAGEGMLLEFVDRHEPEDFSNVHAKELNFEIVVGTALIRGFIDRVDYEGGINPAIHITDYKSGKWEVSQKIVVDNLQLGIYVLACSLLFPEVDVFRAELYYLRSGKRKGHTFMRSDVPALEQRIIGEIYRIVHDQNYLATTSNPRVCSFCDFASWDLCKVGAGRNNRR